MKLPEVIPARIARLPRDQRGYPVPWFVSWIDGVPDFRVVDDRKTKRAVEEGLCFICGDKLGGYAAFTIGPMCAINRVSAEPPSHRDCAIFSALACPFLNNPAAPRRETKMPAGYVESGPADSMIRRNPGVTLVWVMRKYGIASGAKEGWLFTIGEPTDVLFYREGRPATRAEVEESIRSGLPILEAKCDEAPCATCERGVPMEPDGIHHDHAGRARCPRAMGRAALREEVERAWKLLPPEEIPMCQKCGANKRTRTERESLYCAACMDKMEPTR